MRPSTDAYRDWDGAYVLGSLSPAERRDYERHLRTCESCATEVRLLAGIPGILSAVPRQQAGEMLGTETHGPGLVNAVDAARRGGRVRALARRVLLVVARYLSPPERRRQTVRSSGRDAER